LRDAADRSKITTMADRSRCPSCGERVSPYAAGCAICGADLDPSRWDTGPGASQRAGSFLSALTFSSSTGKWLLIGAVLLVLGAPVLAMLGVY
jgi:hypothetical protein